MNKYNTQDLTKPLDGKLVLTKIYWLCKAENRSGYRGGLFRYCL